MLPGLGRDGMIDGRDRRSGPADPGICRARREGTRAPPVPRGSRAPPGHRPIGTAGRRVRAFRPSRSAPALADCDGASETAPGGRHGEAPGDHHRGGGAGLPQLQHPLPQRRGLRGRGLHRRPDPRHRRPPLPGGAGRPPLPAGHPHLRRGGPPPPHRGPRRRRVRLLLQRRLLQLRDAPQRGGPGRRRHVHPARPAGHPTGLHQAGRLGVRGAHRVRQEPDGAPGHRGPHGPRAARWWRCAIPCPTATWRRRRCSASPPWTTWNGTTAPSRRWRSTSRTSCGATSSTPGWTTRPSSERPSRTRTAATSSCGTAGNNDFSFYRPDLAITVVDPHRPGHEIGYYPGEVNLRTADVVVINKIDSADPAGVATVRANIAAVNPRAAWSRPTRPCAWTTPRVVAGQAGAGGGGRAHPHPRRHEDRGGDGGGAALRGRRPGRPPALPGGEPPETFATYPGIGTLLPGHGLRGGATGRPGGHHRRHPGRRRGHRHPHRPGPRSSASTSPTPGSTTTCEEIGTPNLAGIRRGVPHPARDSGSPIPRRTPCPTTSTTRPPSARRLRPGRGRRGRRPGAPVAGCPGWDVAELVWHITEVHYFWAEIVAGRLHDPERVPPLERPEGFPALLARFRAGVEHLAAVLAAADPAAPVWTWARQKDAAFVIRHQAQETAVHRWDAEQAAGRAFAIEPALAADSIDEFFEHTAARREGAEAVGGTVHLHATDGVRGVDHHRGRRRGAPGGAAGHARATPPCAAPPRTCSSSSTGASAPGRWRTFGDAGRAGALPGPHRPGLTATG